MTFLFGGRQLAGDGWRAFVAGVFYGRFYLACVCERAFVGGAYLRALKGGRIFGDGLSSKTLSNSIN